jgi:flagellar motor component MotA
LSTNGVGPSQQGVFVIMERSEVEYARDHLITDGMRINVKNVGVSTVMRNLLREAIAAHRKQQREIKARLSVVGNVDRSRLMAGR